MAVHIDGIPANHPILKNDRIVSFFYRRMNNLNKLGIYSPPIPEELIKQYAKSSTSAPQKNNDELADELYGIFKQHCPDDSEFSWLDEKDSRLCFFCWRLLFISTINQQLEIDLVHTANFNPPFVSFKKYLSIMSIKNHLYSPTENNYPNTAREARKIIISFIDSFNVSKDYKSIIIKSLANESRTIMMEKSLSSWISQDDTELHLTWIYNYLKTNLNVNVVLFSKSTLMFEVQSFFDTLKLFNDIEYRYHVSSMKKAWSQKNFRDNRKNKKQYCFNMSTDISEILDELCKKEKATRGELIESMIRNKHKNI